ncbi:hypothetical protein pdam_00009768, partial [Pocillopora damicornis]
MTKSNCLSQKVLQVDPGREFMGVVTKAMAKRNVRIRRGNVNVHRHTGLVDQEMNFKEGKRSNERVKRPLEVELALNEKVVDVKSSTTYSRPVGLKKKRLDSSKNVRYLYAAGELEGGELVLYYLKDRPKRDFVPEELQIVPPGIELPPN